MGDSLAEPAVANHGREDALDLLGRVSKLFGLAIGILYVAGFLVESIHLAGYGVFSISNFHLQYLIAGTWALGPITLSAAINRASEQFQPLVEDRNVSLLRHSVMSGLSSRSQPTATRFSFTTRPTPRTAHTPTSSTARNTRLEYGLKMILHASSKPPGRSPCSSSSTSSERPHRM